MRVIGVIVQVLLFVLLLVESGCEPVAAEPAHKTDNGFNASVYTDYAPVKINIMPLTEFASADEMGEPSKINLYVSLLDSFGSQKKSPGVFRFELYEKVQRCAEPKGKRAVIWPDIDLTDAVENNKHWRDFLRAYEFNLDFGPESGQSYILQVTCLCPNGKRLSAEFGLGPPK